MTTMFLLFYNEVQTPSILRPAPSIIKMEVRMGLSQSYFDRLPNLSSEIQVPLIETYYTTSFFTSNFLIASEKDISMVLTEVSLTKVLD